MSGTFGQVSDAQEMTLGSGFPDVGCEHDDAIDDDSNVGLDTHWHCPDCGEDWWD